MSRAQAIPLQDSNAMCFEFFFPIFFHYLAFVFFFSFLRSSRGTSGNKVRLINICEIWFFKIANLTLHFLRVIHCNSTHNAILALIATHTKFLSIQYAIHFSSDRNKVINYKSFCVCHYEKVVRNRTGNCSETMYHKSWNVEEFIGRYA